MSQNLFESLSLSPEVLQAVGEMNYNEMTPIQAAAIPLILDGQDIVGRSSTGTGKTAAFGLPAVERCGRVLPNRPQVLVLAPTRELALQISGEMRKYAKFKPSVRIATIYGGDSITAQMGLLRTANLVVGTPGRVMDHMRRETLLLDQLEMVVLDEADEMLNMGFVDDIRQILSAAPEERQTLLFSATMPPAILSLTRQFQHEPRVVAVDGGQRTLDSIEQLFYHVPQTQKMQALNLLLQRYGGGRSLVFCNTRRMVDELTEYLAGCGFSAASLHGEMTQNLRSKVMSDFKMGRLSVLVATDVAARGIDVEDVRAVFNYDIPEDDESYIHRIGRTGRAGRSGASHTLACTPGQIRRVKELERFLRQPIHRAYLPKKDEIYELRRSEAKERVLAQMNTMDNLTWGPVVEELVASGVDLSSLACTLMRLSATENAMDLPDAADIIPVTRPQQPRAAQGSADPAARGPKKPRRTLGADSVTLTASIGRAQRIAPNFLVSAIVEGASVPAAQIGKIDIFPDFSRIEVTPEAAKRILQTMQLTRIKGCRVRFSLDANAPAAHAHGAKRPPVKRPRKEKK